jgi:hypothetical protein
MAPEILVRVGDRGLVRGVMSQTQKGEFKGIRPTNEADGLQAPATQSATLRRASLPLMSPWPSR